jgi:hypothetical protein
VPAVCMAYLDLAAILLPRSASLARQLPVVGAILLFVGGLPLRYALRVADFQFVRYGVRYGADAVRYRSRTTQMSATD